MVAIIDYDAGNIKSVEKALKHLECDMILTQDEATILSADHVILPGVGAFGDAMHKLKEHGMIPVISQVVSKGIPLMGICLGMQLLFEGSEEARGVDGLGILPGRVVRFDREQGLKIPHMGWNSLEVDANSRLFRDIPQGSYVYFVHSYYLDARDKSMVAARTDYGRTFDAAVEWGNVFGCQFHPEKSAEIGLKVLQNFVEV